MTDKEKAVLLFEEIGGIDEEILKECSEFYPVIRQRKKKRRIVAFAAAAAILTVFVACFSFAFEIQRSLSGVLDKPKNSASAGSKQYLEETEVRAFLFSGSPGILYREEGVPGYVFVYLSPAQFRQISSCMEQPEELPEEEEKDCKVWVSNGKGQVMSPYLEKTLGNLSYGALFDYEEEVLPNGELQSLLREYLSWGSL